MENGKKKFMFRSKIAAAFILSAAVFFSACSKENVEENIYYSPFQSEDSAPGRLENSFFYIDIYDYDGDLIGRLDLSDVTEFAKCAQYLCSTDKYIFIGEESTPLCRGVYVVEKQRVKDCFSQARQIY